MKPIVPVVVDTNVLVPALYRYTPIAKFLLSGNLVLIWNNYTDLEAKRIILKLADRYIRKAGVYPEEANELLDVFSQAGIKTTEMPISWPEMTGDRKDDPFLWVAVNSNAEYVITKDRPHLLALNSFRGIPIGKPRDFFTWVEIVHPMSV